MWFVTEDSSLGLKDGMLMLLMLSMDDDDKLELGGARRGGGVFSSEIS